MIARRILIMIAVAMSAAVSPVRSQSPDALTAFEVASIKPVVNGIISGDGAARIGWEPGGNYRMDDGSVGVLLRSAYPDVVEIRGLGGWAATAHYNVLAKAQREPTREEQAALVRELLADRFKLVAHVEYMDRDTYALRVARSGVPGPQMKRTPVGCAEFSKLSPEDKAAIPPPVNGAPRCGTMVSDRRMLSGGITMDILAANLSSRAGRVVINETSLSGHYELTLELGPDVSVFTAVREQLGLTLEPSRAALPVLIVDRIEPPTPD